MKTAEYELIEQAARGGLFSPELMGKHFAVLGTLSMPLYDIAWLIRLNGGTYHESVRDGLDYVICDADIAFPPIVPPSCMVISEARFAEMLRRKDDEQ